MEILRRLDGVARALLSEDQPALIGQYPVSGIVKDVFVNEEYIYAVNGLGLVIEPAVTLHSALE